MLFAIGVKAQQDTQMSQYIFNGIYINPAYAGYKEDMYVQSYFRSQWVGLTGAPESFSIAADGALTNANIGLGVMINSDHVGAQNTLSGYLNYAYKIHIGNDETSVLSFGLAGGIEQLGIDGSKLNAIQTGDSAIPITSQTTTLPDANFGMYYSNSSYFVGLSATNILAKYVQKNNSSNVLVPVPQPHIYFTGGTLIDLSGDMKLKPVFLLKDDFKGPTTLDVDAFFIFNGGLSLGAFYRNSIKLYPKTNLQNNYTNQNAFGGVVEFFATPSLRIGYSYDHALNALGTYNYGSHELSVGFYINGDSRSGKSRALRCYQF